jgi:hypothetical protein
MNIIILMSDNRDQFGDDYNALALIGLYKIFYNNE